MNGALSYIYLSRDLSASFFLKENLFKKRGYLISSLDIFITLMYHFLKALRVDVCTFVRMLLSSGTLGSEFKSVPLIFLLGEEEIILSSSC